jgi:hypothetical protein
VEGSFAGSLRDLGNRNFRDFCSIDEKESMSLMKSEISIDFDD